MNRIIPAGCLAALFLAGCNSPSQHTPVPRNYGAASDVAVTGTLSTHYGTKVCFPANFRFQRGLIF